MEFDFLLRIFTAAILGGLIGLEREYRSKEAGFRTHFLVALGSALFMIVSAYGFEGVMTTADLPKGGEHRQWTDNGCGPVGDSGYRTGLWRWYVCAQHWLYTDGAAGTGSL